jgi:hypothetical protein
MTVMAQGCRRTPELGGAQGGGGAGTRPNGESGARELQETADTNAYPLPRACLAREGAIFSHADDRHHDHC